MRPSPFHKGSGEGTAAAAAVPEKPAAAKKPAARSRKVVTEVTTLAHCSCCTQCLDRVSVHPTHLSSRLLLHLAAAAANLHVLHACRSPRSPFALAVLVNYCGCSCSRMTMTTRTWRRRQHQCRQQLQVVLGGPWPPSPTRSQSRRMRAMTLTLQSPHETAPCTLARQAWKHQAASSCKSVCVTAAKACCNSRDAEQDIAVARALRMHFGSRLLLSP